jgi:hypothetical protein
LTVGARDRTGRKAGAQANSAKQGS